MYLPPVFFMDKITSLINEINKSVLKTSHIHCAYNKMCGQLSLDDIFTTDIVYMEAKRCASGFGDKSDTRAFMKNAWVNSYRLCEKVLNGKYKPRYYPKKTIIERGKARIIKPPYFECKVVQKVLCDFIIRPLFEPKMVSTCYASVRGRGTEKMLQDIVRCLNKTYLKNPKAFITTVDFTGYFASIDVNILKEIFLRYIMDERIVELIVLFSDEDGLSLGNETSQIPASFFPSFIDHYFKDRLGVKLFRYMDDSLFVTEDKDMAERLEQLYIELAASRKLSIGEQKIHTYPIGTSITFCKEALCFNHEKGYYYRNINHHIVVIQEKKMKEFSKMLIAGSIPFEYVSNQFRTVRGMISSKPNTHKVVSHLNELYAEILIKMKNNDCIEKTE